MVALFERVIQEINGWRLFRHFTHIFVLECVGCNFFNILVRKKTMWMARCASSVIFTKVSIFNSLSVYFIPYFYFSSTLSLHLHQSPSSSKVCQLLSHYFITSTWSAYFLTNTFLLPIYTYSSPLPPFSPDLTQ